MKFYFDIYRRDSITILVLILLVLAFFSQLFFPESRIFVTPDFGLSDLFQLNYPAKFSLSEALKNNQLPIWNKNIGAGFPQLAEGQIGAYNLLNLILYKMFPFAFAIRLGYIFIFLTSVVGTYIFLRMLKNHYIPAAIGSILFGFSGFFITHMGHINLIHSASMLPWVFVLLFAYIRYKKIYIALILAIVLSQQFFAGFPQISFITGVGVVLYAFWSLYTKEIGYKHLLVLSLSVALSLVLSVAQILPTKELLDISTRSDSFSLDGATRFSYTLKHFATFLYPYALGNPAEGTYGHFSETNGSVFWENTGYIGVLPLIFAIFAFKRRRKKTLLFFLLLLLFSAALMLGSNSPSYLVFSFPVFNLFRVPSRFILLFIWALVVISTFGIDVLFKHVKNYFDYKKAAVVIGILGLLMVLDVCFFACRYNPTGLTDSWFKKPDSLNNIELDQTRIFSLGQEPIWEEVTRTSGWNNLEAYHQLQNFSLSNFNLLFDTASFDVYRVITTRRYNGVLINGLVFDLVENGEIEASTSLQNFLKANSISHIISAYPFKDMEEEHLINGPLDSRIFTYKIPNVNKRADMFFDVVKNDTVSEFFSTFADEDHNPNRIVVVEDALEIDENVDTPIYSVEWVKDENTDIQLQVESDSEGLLVLSDSYYPGWQAFINNIETKIYPANLNSKAIIVPAGDHEIRFKYFPESIRKGLFITVAAYAFTMILILYLVRSEASQKS